VPDTKLPESTFEQQVKIKPEESETFQIDTSHFKPDERESLNISLKTRRKKRLAFGIGAVILIAVLGIIVSLDKFSPQDHMPDLSIINWEIEPSTPTQGKPVNVNVEITNSGKATAGSFVVAWWPGENYPEPHTWTVDKLKPGERKSLSYSYPGYPTRYARLTTKLTINPYNSVQESNTTNNESKRTIIVKKN
jgi:hypothetical protein